MTVCRQILIDCDGVLLDWVPVFDQWMTARGLMQKPEAQGYYLINDRFEDVNQLQAKKYTKLFNESSAIGFLPPMRDAQPWVGKLVEQDYRFVVITSLSTDPWAQRLRRQNLQEAFGDIFDEIICLPTGDDKDQALEPYRNSKMWWIEDKPQNAELGHKLGLKSILLTHDHNLSYDHAEIRRADNWQEIYHIINQDS